MWISPNRMAVLDEKKVPLVKSRGTGTAVMWIGSWPPTQPRIPHLIARAPFKLSQICSSDTHATRNYRCMNGWCLIQFSGQISSFFMGKAALWWELHLNSDLQQGWIASIKLDLKPAFGSHRRMRPMPKLVDMTARDFSPDARWADIFPSRTSTLVIVWSVINHWTDRAEMRVVQMRSHSVPRHFIVINANMH